MSAVMSTLSIISGGRRGHRKLTHSSGRKSGQLSDAGEDRRGSQHDLKHQQRSASLQTLENSGGGAGVVDLDSLEAKMASIEVSLGGGGGRRRSTCTRDVSREVDALKSALQDRDTLIMSLKKQLSASLSAARLAVQSSSPTKQSREDSNILTAEDRSALEERASAVRDDLETRKNNIQELRRRLERTHVTDNIDTRIQQAELQYQLGREELELLSLSEQARALHQLIEHAALHHTTTLYSAVRECGGIGTVVSAETRDGGWGASSRGGALFVEWSRDCPALRPGDRVLEVNGVTLVTCRSQEEVQRAVSLASPVRVLALRSHLPPASTLTQNEAASLRAELGSLRSSAEVAEKAKESLRSDNTRLTHRISYLEEQVAELLARHTQLESVSSSDSCITVNKTKKNVTNISITSEPVSCKPSRKSEVQVFQKGPDITAIVAKLPGLDGAEASLPVMRPRSNASGASTKIPISPRGSPTPNHRSYTSQSCEPKTTRMRHSLSHHCIHANDYTMETDAAIRMIERNQRHMEKQRSKVERISRCASDDHFSDLDKDHKNQPIDRHYEIKKAANRIEESIKKTNWAERKTMSLIEQIKRSQRLRKLKKNESSEDIQIPTDSEKHYLYHRIDGKVLENAHKSRRSSKIHSRSAKSSELESECSDFPSSDIYYSSPKIDYSSESGARVGQYKKNEDRRPDGESKTRPTPPKKPLRLSLHKARSAHSLLNGSETEMSRPPSEAKSNGDIQSSPTKKPVKRTHASDKLSKDKMREAGRSTPRPSRKLLNGFSACEAPAADDLYPDNTHSPRRTSGVGQPKWC